MTRRDAESRAATGLQRVVRGHLARAMMREAYAEFEDIGADIQREVAAVFKGYSASFHCKDRVCLSSFRDELNGRVLWGDAAVSPKPTPSVKLESAGQPEDPVVPSGGAYIAREGMGDIPLEDLIKEAERLEASLLSRIQTLRHPLLD